MGWSPEGANGTHSELGREGHALGNRRFRWEMLNGLNVSPKPELKLIPQTFTKYLLALRTQK